MLLRRLKEKTLATRISKVQCERTRDIHHHRLGHELWHKVNVAYHNFKQNGDHLSWQEYQDMCQELEEHNQSVPKYTIGTAALERNET